MKIQDDIKLEVEKRISAFNSQNNCKFIASFKGKFLYLDRTDSFGVTHIFRLTFSGDIESWNAAVYKYDREVYDVKEVFFSWYGTYQWYVRSPLIIQNNHFF